MTLAIVLVALVALVGVVAIGWPLLTGAQPDVAAAEDVGTIELSDEIERSLRALKELEFDHRAGNLSDADFAELDRLERARAAELLRRRDAAQG